jgi:osmotically-inducible protein OsmY
MRYQTITKDPVIAQRVNETLSKMGIRAPCRVTVASNKGNVTLAGTIQYEHQRHMTVHAVQGVEGVQRVVDQMHVIPRSQH